MVVRVRSVVMSGCYYGSRSIGGWDPEDPEDPGQETETQNMHLGFVVIQQLTASPNRRCTTWEAFNALSKPVPVLDCPDVNMRMSFIVSTRRTARPLGATSRVILCGFQRFAFSHQTSSVDDRDCNWILGVYIFSIS